MHSSGTGDPKALTTTLFRSSRLRKRSLAWEAPLLREAGLPYVDQYGWRLTKLNYAEVMHYVTTNHLVMLEATYLTAAKSFADAQTEGRANLRSRSEFDSMLDIQVARTAVPAVTPLPVLNV